MEPSGNIFTRFGPNAPKCSQTDAEPGPPLKEMVNGRLDTGWSVSSI
jgi:hypothetical protein